MHIASIAAYILKQGVRHMSTQFKKKKKTTKNPNKETPVFKNLFVAWKHKLIG